jgi:hypothetical protein
MCLDFPELSKDRNFKANVGLVYNRDLEFQDQVEMTNLKKKSEFIQGLSELKVKIGEEEVPYFDNDFLIQRYLGMSPEQIKMNKQYKEEEEKQAKKAKPEGGEEPPEGGEEETPQLTL